MGLAIIGGVVIFLVVGALVSQTVVHNSQSSAGFLSGAVATAWCIWPALKGLQRERYNTLSPVPKKYPLQWKYAFAKVREILDRANYKLGARWHVSIADTQSRRIYASLQFTDEENGFVPGAGIKNMSARAERVRRLVELDVQFEEQGDSTVIQLDFQTKAEGNNQLYACDFVVQDIKEAIEREMGPGVAVGSPEQFVLGAPPWWLLGVTAFGLMNLWGEVMKTVFGK